jgi:hypothetical protein
VVGSYLPPVFKISLLMPVKYHPPQTIMTWPSHTAVCSSRPWGALMVLVAVQVSVPGLYLPPVSKTLPKRSDPPQTII